MSTAIRERVERASEITDPYFYGYRENVRIDESGNRVWDPIPLTETDILFPQEGDHNSQNALHDDNRDYLKRAIRWRLESKPGSYCLADHRVDFELDFEPLAPDIIAFAADRPWDVTDATYPVKTEGASIHFVVELTSPSTRNKDLGDKVDYYGKGNVPLYVIFDNHILKTGIESSFLVYRCAPDGMTRLRLAEPFRVWLPVAELWLTCVGGRLLCMLPDGSPVPDFSGAMKAAERERALADAEKSRADALALELAELKAKISPP